MIEHKCENCCVCDKAGDETHDIYRCLCSDDKPCFSPKEELVRNDCINDFKTIINGIYIETNFKDDWENFIYSMAIMRFKEKLLERLKKYNV